MTVDEEGLWVDDELAIRTLGNDRLHALGGLRLQRAARSDDRDAHAPLLRLLGLVSAMGGLTCSRC